MSVSGLELASVPCTALAPGRDGRCGNAPPERREAQRHVVKSGAVPGHDRLPVCSGLVSIAEVGECCRARSGTPSVAADGGIERAKPALTKVSGGDAAAPSERRCSELALNPASFTRRRGSGSGAPEVNGCQVSDRKKTPIRPQPPVAEVSRAS
jgi:hypothetical protein